MAEQRRDCVVPADHPCLAGHFPGNPIVPGVLLLDCVLAAVEGAAGRRLAGIPNLKFLHPLRPGVSFSIVWTEHADGLRFRCESDADGAPQLYAQGLLSFADDSG